MFAKPSVGIRCRENYWHKLPRAMTFHCCSLTDHWQCSKTKAHANCFGVSRLSVFSHFWYITSS